MTSSEIKAFVLGERIQKILCQLHGERYFYKERDENLVLKKEPRYPEDHYKGKWPFYTETLSNGIRLTPCYFQVIIADPDDYNSEIIYPDSLFFEGDDCFDQCLDYLKKFLEENIERI